MKPDDETQRPWQPNKQKKQKEKAPKTRCAVCTRGQKTGNPAVCYSQKVHRGGLLISLETRRVWIQSRDPLIPPNQRDNDNPPHLSQLTRGRNPESDRKLCSQGSGRPGRTRSQRVPKIGILSLLFLFYVQFSLALETNIKMSLRYIVLR